jgi:MFS family permease
MGLTETFDEEIRQNFRFNFIVNIGDVALYMFGYSFISPAAILPLYLAHFTQNPIILGLIPFIGTVGFLVPQLFSSNLIERAPIKKYYPFNIGLVLERLPIFLMAPVTFLFAGKYPITTLILILLLYTWHSTGAGFIMVGWQDMIAKIIPVEKRGRFFGYSNFIGNIAGILGASAIAWMLVNFSFPDGYVIAFSCASVCLLISWLFLGLTREPPDTISKPVISNREYFKTLPLVIQSNPNFRNFLFSQIIAAFGGMAGGFIMVYALQKWDIPDGQAAAYGIVLLVGQSIANLAFGYLADRKGHKINLEIALIFNVAAFLMALLATTPGWFFVVFMLRGISMAASFVSSMSFPLEFSEPKDRPTYIGLASTIPGVAGAVAPILGGILASTLGYTVLFSTSIVIGLAALSTLHWIVRDPRYSHPTIHPVVEPGN